MNHKTNNVVKLGLTGRLFNSTPLNQMGTFWHLNGLYGENSVPLFVVSDIMWTVDIFTIELSRPASATHNLIAAAKNLGAKTFLAAVESATRRS